MYIYILFALSTSIILHIFWKIYKLEHVKFRRLGAAVMITIYKSKVIKNTHYMNAILYFKHCKRIGVTSPRKYHLSVLFFPRRSAALVLRAVTRNRVCASRKTTCTCHGRHIFLLPANLNKTVLNVPWLVILKNQSEASYHCVPRCAWRRVASQNKYGGFFVCFDEEFLEGLFPPRAPGMSPKKNNVPCWYFESLN